MGELISVIVPVYNVEQYLERCVDSILASTYTNLEVILVDDGSTDRSGEICDQYEKKDSRIRVIHKENGGEASARNCGVDEATGRYIGFVDSDDAIEQDMYCQLYNDLVDNNAQISMCGCKIISDKKIILKNGTNTFFVWNKEDALKQLISGEIEPAVWNKLYLRELYRNVRFEDLYCNTDFLANYFLMKNIEKAVFRDVCLYRYTRRSDSISGQRFNRKKFDLIKAARMANRDIEMDLPQLSEYGMRHLVAKIIECYNHSLPYDDYAADRVGFVCELKKIQRSGVKLGAQKRAIILLITRVPSLYLLALSVRKMFRKIRYG